MQEIKKNIKEIKQLLNNNQKLCVVSKANCYGLGDKIICKELNFLVDYFAVSSVGEFLKIRNVVTKPILILDPIYENITKVCFYGAHLTVSNFESFSKIKSAAKNNVDTKFHIHIAVNTGMNRFGFSSFVDVDKIFKECKKVQNIVICGVFTHYFNANNEFFAKKQFNEFLEVKKYLIKKQDITNVVFHIANSEGVEKRNGFDMTRIGLRVYTDKNFPTISLKSKIIEFQFLKCGDTAGYGGCFVTTKETKIAIVAIGYADGLFRNIVKNGYVLIKGCYCKIIAICMDSLLVDVTNVKCKINDEVVLIGKSGDNQIFVCDVAEWCDTIEYEILTKISKRVKRKYIF